MFLGREPVKAGGSSTAAGWSARPRALLEEVGEASFDPRTPVARLSVAQQQVVEIVKALSLNARILVLDEPTAALADHEVELLFTLVRRLQERGVGILYISHRLREVFAARRPHHRASRTAAWSRPLDTAECDQRDAGPA